MAKKRVVNMDDPYMSTLAGISKGGRPGQVAARFPAPGRIRTSIKMHLQTVNHPEGIYYPIVYQSDLSSPLETPPRLHVFRQRQWVGGMGQRVMADESKFMVGAAFTLRMNEFLPQPYAMTVQAGSIGGYTVGEYTGVPMALVEWQGVGASPTKRRVYLATYDVSTTPTVRVYILASNDTDPPQFGWILWKTFANWQYGSMTVIQKEDVSELRVLGTAYGKAREDPDSRYWKATVCTLQESDWSQDGTGYSYVVTTPDGNYGAYQSTFYYPNGSVKVGTSEYGNQINNVVSYYGNIVIIKPDGIYTYTKAGNLVSLKVNLRSYFDTETGKQACQWGQLLYFNLGKLLASFDGEKIVIAPPVWDWADPEWIPSVRGMGNCGEGLGVGFADRVAIWDGQDWHNLYRKGADRVTFTTAYSATINNVSRYGALVITCAYPTGGSGGTGKTRLHEFYPSFFKPYAPDTTAGEPSFLVSSAFEVDDTSVLIFRDFKVRARNLSATYGLRVWGRAAFYPDSTTGFIPMRQYPEGSLVQVGPSLEQWYTFTVPSELATLTGFQYKVEFVPAVPGKLQVGSPAVTDVRVNVINRDGTHRRRWDFQVLCMDDYEFPDGTVVEYSAADMARILEEAQYQDSPVRLGFWQPGTIGRDPCWVYYDVMLKLVQHIAYVDESDVTGFIYQFHAEEI